VADAPDGAKGTTDDPDYGKGASTTARASTSRTASSSTVSTTHRRTIVASNSRPFQVRTDRTSWVHLLVRVAASYDRIA
jgi:hypothetical protein